MAETAITVQTLDSAWGGEIEDVTWTALTATEESNGFDFANTGKEFLLIKATTTTGGTQAIVLTSVADRYGRTGDLTVTTSDDEFSIAGPFPPHLWNASDGNVSCTISDSTGMSVAVVRFRQASE